MVDCDDLRCVNDVNCSMRVLYYIGYVIVELTLEKYKTIDYLQC